MTALALAVYAVLLVPAGVLVWRRPVVALFVFVVGLAAHNLVMALLYGAGIRHGPLEAISAWKEILLAVAVARVAVDAIRARALPFRPTLVDWLALAFGAIVVCYALVPQSALGGGAGAKAVLYGLRHGLVPVVSFFVGRSLGITVRQLRALVWTLLGAAAAVATFGLVEEYTVDLGWWRQSGAVGYFRDQLGFDYHGPGGMPENFAFNSSGELFRRLISTFVSPLAAAYMLVVALLLAPLRRLAVPLIAAVAAGLLFTISRSALVGLVAGLVVLALARRTPAPLAVAVVTVAIGVGFAYSFRSFAPRTHFTPAELRQQEAYAKAHPGASKSLFSGNEPSIRSHLTNLRDGLDTVVHHPQGFGLGNAGATASRFGVKLEAGESNYTETGVETGLAGMLLLVAWNLALLVGLVRSARAAGDPTLRAGTAGLAASLAAVLVLAIQTDIYGVPWIAYTIWWLAGSLLEPAAAGVPEPARAAWRRRPRRAPVSAARA